MSESGLGAATPQPVPGLESERVLVMTRLFGYKVRSFFFLSFTLLFWGLICM